MNFCPIFITAIIRKLD